MAFGRYLVWLSAFLVLRFDPRSYPEQPLFNAGMSGALPEEIAYLIDRFVKDQTLVVIGIDPFTGLTQRPMVDLRFADFSLDNILAQSISYKALRMSLATLGKELLGVPYHVRRDGYADLRDPDLGAAAYDERYWNAVAMLADDMAGADAEMRLPAYRHIRDALAARGIRVVTFFQPLNRDILDALRDRGAMARLETWKARVREIFPGIRDLLKSEFSAREFYRTGGPGHYNAEAATRIIGIVLGGGAED